MIKLVIMLIRRIKMWEKLKNILYRQLSNTPATSSNLIITRNEIIRIIEVMENIESEYDKKH